MTHENDAPATNVPPVSRRGFLRATLATARAGALPQLLARRLEAADAGKPAAPRPPLDQLSAAELADAVRLLREAKKLGESFRFVSCVLDEPPKPAVLAHRPGRPFPRRAFLVLLDNATGTGYEA